MMKNSTFIKSLFLLLCMIAGGIGSTWADTVTLVSASGTSGYAIPDGWTTSGTVAGSSYLKFEDGTMTSPEFAPHTGLSFTYSVATFGSGTNNPLTIRILDASTDAVIVETTTSTPTSSNYITTGSPLSLGDVSVPFKIQLYGPSGKGVRLRNYSITGTPAGGSSSAVATTTTIDATGITNTDVYAGTKAGLLAATVVDNEENEVEGATVTWSGDNDEVATIDEEGNVTLVAAGTVTFTATYAGVEDEYKASSDTFELTVIDSTPLPTYTVTFGDEGSVTQETPGAEVTLPSRSDIGGYTFAGWSEANVAEETTTAPTIIPAGGYIPTADITLYPVYTKTEGDAAPTAFSVGNTGSYAIVAFIEGNYWALPTNPTVDNGKIKAQKITVSETGGVKYVTPANANGFTWTIAAATNGYTLSDGSHYIYHSNGGASGTNLAYGDATNYTWSFTADGDYIKMAGMNGSTTNSRGLLFNGSTIGGYALSNWTNSSYAKTMILPVANAGTTYYWSAPVAAAVEKPVISVTSPFTFSTEVEITCETENATIYYTLDGTEPTAESNEYTAPFNINATTTIKAIAIKGSDASSIAEVTATKNLAVPTVAIDATGITNTNVFDGTSAGSLAASVTYNDAAVEGAEVTWSGDNDDVATIDAETGAVTLVGAGTVTFTATYAGNSDYAEKTATYEMTVTNTDPNAPGTQNNPYTVAEAITFIGTLGSATSATEVYVSGIISQVDSYNSKYGSITYWISDDGTTDDQMEVYSGLNIDGEQFSAKEDLQVGDIVTVKGYVKMYNTTPEFTQNNELVSLVRVEKPVAPTFSVAEGTYTEAQSVELSTTTEGATIYYTLDGTEPTAESTEYTSAIEITETTTVKAIAIKDDVASDVATATYTIDLTPSIVFDGNQNPLNVSYNAYNTNVHYVASNTTGDITLVVCDEQGNAATYEWFSAEITSNVYVHVTLQANEDTENARTAYFKLVADNAESEIFAITQAKFVADYATLPFAFDGGRANIETTSGLTQDGLDSDYSDSPKLKFNGTGDYVILKLNERPGTLSFDIKGNGFSGGTFTVQTSADGETYTDLESYTSLGNTQSEEFDNLGENVRYIKWIYTEKVSGNVALGNIALAAYTEPVLVASITVDPATVNASADETYDALELTYANFTVSGANIFDVQFYDGEGNELQDAPDWIDAEVETDGEDYIVSYILAANDGEARTAYFKVYAMVDETNLVYSNLVTVTQAAYVAPGVTDNYALFTGELIEGDYIIYYDGYAMKNTVESDRLSYEEMTPVNDVITTDNAAIVWHIAKSGDYWTIYNADAEAYAASTGAKNKAQMLADGTDDKALWTVSRYGDAYEFVNKKNSDANVNAYLRNNGTFGFACYASTTGGDLTLYKKVIPVTGEATITLNAACTDGEFVYGTYSNASAFVVPSDLTVSEIAIIDGTLLVEEYSTGAVVPANTGVMVAATADGDYTVDLTSDAGKSVLGDDNRLRATGAGISAEEMGADTDCVFYRLTMHNGSDLGFWWGAENGAAFTIAANKAYLAVPKTVGARIQGFSFDDGIVTGIANMNREAMTNNGSVYNMKGQRVAQPAKGLYIQNGKKVVVK